MKRAVLCAVLALLAFAPAAHAQATSNDSEAPPGSPPHWLPNEQWVYQHWLPYDEKELYKALGMTRGQVWRILRDDARTVALAAQAKGIDPQQLAETVVDRSWRGVQLEPGRRDVLVSRALRTLTQGHLAQHMFFHSLHQNAIPDNAPKIFGVASRAEFQALRRQELSPLMICRLYGHTAADTTAATVSTLKAYAARGVHGQAIPAVQAKRLLARQLRQVPRWLQQTRYNGPPPVKQPRISTATASNYSNNAAMSNRGPAWEAYEAALPVLRQKGEINVFAALDGTAPALTSGPNAHAFARKTPRSAYNPAISADGRFVAFEAAEGNLNFAKRYGEMQVFLHDAKRGSSRLVSVPDADFGRPESRSAYNPTVSANGRWVAYESSESVHGHLDVFVRDMRTKRSRRVVIPGDKAYDLSEPELSGDGHFLTFSGLERGAAGESEVYVQDLTSGKTAQISPGTGESYEPSISFDGRFVAYTSSAQADADQTRVLRWDRTTGVSNVLAPTGGLLGRDSVASAPSISADGRRVAFSARALWDRATHVYVWDATSALTSLVSRATGSEGAPASGTSGAPSISPDGQRVAFTSDAHELSPQKCNPARGVFVRDLAAHTTTLVSRGDGSNRGVGPTTWSSGPDSDLVALECA